ncbi:MAG: DoxX family protein [Paracoccaceae bacterium]
MNALLSLHKAIVGQIEQIDWLLPTLARIVFAATLLMYFWVSALTKLGDGFIGLFIPSDGAYAQVFPKAFEAAGYNIDALGTYHWAVVVVGTWTEFVLPAFIVLGFLTRLSAVGMIVFVTVQTMTDLYSHGSMSDPETLGAWFDRFPNSVILDQRALWIMLLLILVFKGAGPLSLDAALHRGVAAR